MRSLIFAALLTSACTIGAKDSPISPSPPPPSAAPATIQILAASRADRLVDVSAVVLTVDGKSVRDVSVTFSASSGTLSPDVSVTDSSGTARAVFTPAAAQATVRAQAGELSAAANILGAPPVVPPPGSQPPPGAPPPDPVFPLTVSINVTPAPAGQATGFSLATQALSSASWDFGDGGTAQTSTGGTSHVYATPGSYPVRVSVVDVRGRSASATATASIGAPPPPAAAGMIVLLIPDQSSVPVGGQRTFTATIDNLQPGETVTAYQWDLDGDGKFEATSTTPTRTSAAYTTAGFVTARVAITTNQRSGVGSTTIVVTN